MAISSVAAHVAHMILKYSMDGRPAETCCQNTVSPTHNTPQDAYISGFSGSTDDGIKRLSDVDTALSQLFP